MNVDAILRKHGYKNHDDFPTIAKWAANRTRNKSISEDELMQEVEAKFGLPEWKVKIGMYTDPVEYRLFLSDFLPVDGNAIDQLKTALRLPVAVKGAAMPDLHTGYSLPIGGVVALLNAISPAFVGYDISCMMQLTLFHPGGCAPEDLEDQAVREKFLKDLLSVTSFGLGAENDNKPVDHPVMYHPLWDEIKFLKQYKDLAWRQLGTSGAGNHFAEVVQAQFANGDAFVGLLTHSGSRGIGNKVGHYYAELADKETAIKYDVPKGYGWFDIYSDLGTEYRLAMGLMGEYAEANHQIIHDKFMKVTGLRLFQQFRNKHNFAWVDPGTKFVIHRKGATPAHKDQVGIIPGSSGTPSFLVRGKGNPDSLFSASHGAGRPYSRSEAKRRYDEAQFKDHMNTNGITYYGVAPDETFAAYKPIDLVMDAQRELVEPIAIMFPKIVVMGGNVQSDDGD